MKKRLFFSALVLVVLGLILTGCRFLVDSRLELKSGDILPSSIKLRNVSGEANRIDDIKSKYKVVFYLDSMNDDCIRRLDCIAKMIKLLSFADFRYVLVWEDRIPVDEIKKAGIDSSYNYSLEGKVSLSESKPTAFFADENNKITMVTGYSYISMINKVIELGENKDLSAQAIDMILKSASETDTFPQDYAGKTLLMFISSGCRTCGGVEDIVSKNIDSMQKKINVISVRPDFDIKQEYDQYFEVDPQQIYFNIFACTQRIEASNRKYPMFFIINSDKSIEKFFTDPNEAVNYVLGL